MWSFWLLCYWQLMSGLSAGQCPRWYCMQVQRRRTHSHLRQLHISNSACVCCREFNKISTLLTFLQVLPFITWLINSKLKSGIGQQNKKNTSRTGWRKTRNTGAKLEHSPRKSLSELAQQADVSVSSARTAIELLKIHPHKMIQVQSLQPIQLQG